MFVSFFHWDLVALGIWFGACVCCMCVCVYVCKCQEPQSGQGQPEGGPEQPKIGPEATKSSWRAAKRSKHMCSVVVVISVRKFCLLDMFSLCFLSFYLLCIRFHSFMFCSFWGRPAYPMLIPRCSPYLFPVNTVLFVSPMLLNYRGPLLAGGACCLQTCTGASRENLGKYTKIRDNYYWAI